MNESNDEVILDGLESLAKKGKLRIFNVGVSKGMSIYDCGFGIEVGKGARRMGKGSGTRLHSVGSGEIYFTRQFCEEPLSKSELSSGPAILDVKNQVLQIMGKPCAME